MQLQATDRRIATRISRLREREKEKEGRARRGNGKGGTVGMATLRRVWQANEIAVKMKI